jgi:hypothetical protein
MARRAAAGLILGAALAMTSCGGGSTEVTGVVITRPQNDCRYANDGTVTKVLEDTPVTFTDTATGEEHRTTTDDATITQYPLGQCLESAHYTIDLPQADEYRVEVEFYPAFGGPPKPFSVTWDELEARRFTFDMLIGPGTGE